MSDHVGRSAIEVSGLVKKFGKVRALDGLDLVVPAGTVYGLLGPNGAGKTTTLRILATLLRPDAGEVRVFGHDVQRNPDAARQRISLSGQFSSVDADLTGMENLTLLARLVGYHGRTAADRADQLLSTFGLTDAADRQVKRYSGGMRRRLDFAASILNAPDLLFLDEPTTGLDPRSRTQVWELVRALVDLGTTVLLTTQYLDEADHLASRIAVIDHGRVIAEGTKGELKASVGAGSVQVRLRDAAQRVQAKEVLTRVLGPTIQDDPDPLVLAARVHADGADPAEQASRALAELVASSVTVDNFSFGQPSLDEVFLALTGHPAEHVAGSDAAQEAMV